MEIFTYSVKKTTGLPGLGIPKYSSYDLTIRWMYVLSTETPTIIRAQSKRHTLAVVRIPSCLSYMGEIERVCATPSHKRFLGASESGTSEASINLKKNKFFENRHTWRAAVDYRCPKSVSQYRIRLIVENCRRSWTTLMEREV